MAKLTNLELQALRNVEARQRVARELAEEQARIDRIQAECLRAEYVEVVEFGTYDGERAECCGAPLDVLENTDRYYRAHKQGRRNCPVSEPCEAAVKSARVKWHEAKYIQKDKQSV